MKWRKLIQDVDRVSVNESFSGIGSSGSSWIRAVKWLLFEGYLCNAPEGNGKPQGVNVKT